LQSKVNARFRHRLSPLGKPKEKNMRQQPTPRGGPWVVTAVVLALCHGCGTIETSEGAGAVPGPQPHTVCAVDRLLPPGIPESTLFSWAVVDTGTLWEGDGVRMPIELLSQAPTDIRVSRCPPR
jgi:hypothetical protein